MQVLAPLNLFLKAAFNGYQYGEGCEPKCIGDNYGSYQYLSPEVPRGIYVWFFIPEKDVGDGGYIHPLPLQILVAGSGEVVCVCGGGKGVNGSSRRGSSGGGSGASGCKACFVRQLVVVWQAGLTQGGRSAWGSMLANTQACRQGLTLHLPPLPPPQPLPLSLLRQ
jgi:hypothetical protein